MRIGKVEDKNMKQKGKGNGEKDDHKRKFK